MVFGSAFAHDDDDGHEFLAGFLEGEYTLVGKAIDSDNAVIGTVVLEQHRKEIKGHRLIGGELAELSGTIVHPKCCESTHSLVLIFTSAGRTFEGHYLWSSDLDNYARISGFVYELGSRTNSPGMEVLFNHDSKITD